MGGDMALAPRGVMARGEPQPWRGMGERDTGRGSWQSSLRAASRPELSVTVWKITGVLEHGPPLCLPALGPTN